MFFAQSDLYYTTTTTNIDTTTAAGFGALMLVWLLIVLAFAIVAIVAMWKVFVKAGQPGWAAIIPIYNTYILLKIVGRPTWWLLVYILAFIPIVNFFASIVFLVMWIIIALDLAKAFGKSTTFAVVGLIIFSFIGLLILGFGKDKYLGAPNTPKATATPAQ